MAGSTTRLLRSDSVREAELADAADYAPRLEAAGITLSIERRADDIWADAQVCKGLPHKVYLTLLQLSGQHSVCGAPCWQSVSVRPHVQDRDIFQKMTEEVCWHHPVLERHAGTIRAGTQVGALRLLPFHNMPMKPVVDYLCSIWLSYAGCGGGGGGHGAGERARGAAP